MQEECEQTGFAEVVLPGQKYEGQHSRDQECVFEKIAIKCWRLVSLADQSDFSME